MRIKYLGPSRSVNVGGYGVHMKGEVREYPDAVGEELLETGRKQRFERVGKDAGLTVPQIKAELDARKIEYDPKARKEDLAALLAEAKKDDD